jgi:hypothetical protein
VAGGRVAGRRPQSSQVQRSPRETSTDASSRVPRGQIIRKGACRGNSRLHWKGTCSEVVPQWWSRIAWRSLNSGILLASPRGPCPSPLLPSTAASPIDVTHRATRSIHPGCSCMLTGASRCLHATLASRSLQQSPLVERSRSDSDNATASPPTTCPRRAWMRTWDAPRASIEKAPIPLPPHP